VELIPSIYGQVPNVIATGSMIKCFGCVGLRVGWLLGPGPFIDACRNLKDYTTHTLCAMVELLALRTLQARGVLARRYTEWARANVAAFGALVARHSHVLAWTPPQAGLVAFPRLLTSDIAASDFCVDLFEHTGVFVLPGGTFGRPRHFRVGFGLSPEDFGVAMERCDRYLSERFNA
jgi:aspartate/methionine/tyrosine aminotransferase